MVLPVICSECGNDVATQGQGLCMDCLEEEEAQRLVHDGLVAGDDLDASTVALGELEDLGADLGVEHSQV
jgi:hypothetical protein